MNCFFCKGDFEDKQTTYMVDLENCIVIVKNVPSQVCKQCGEVSYNNNVAHEIESIVNNLKNTISEIAVTNYADKVA